MMAVKHVDDDGRATIMKVPDGAPEKMWGAGILVGPPDLTPLGLSKEVTTKLHNELFNRGIIDRASARRSRPEVHAALMAALRIDAERIIDLYEETGNRA